MKKIERILILMSVLLALYGCAAGGVILRNDKGETVRCEANKGPIDDCVKGYEAQGYKKVEPEKIYFPPMYDDGY